MIEARPEEKACGLDWVLGTINQQTNKYKCLSFGLICTASRGLFFGSVVQLETRSCWSAGKENNSHIVALEKIRQRDGQAAKI